MLTSPVGPRWALWAGVNLGFFLVLLVGVVVGATHDPRLFYLIALFAVCSSSIIDLDGLNGRNALLAIFLMAYFIFYGLEDVVSLFFGSPADFARGASDSSSSPLLDATELVILVGAMLLVIAYRVTVSIGRTSVPKSNLWDWPVSTLLVIGMAFWTIGTWATFTWYVHVVTDVTIEAKRAGLAQLSALHTLFLLTAQMLQPLGVLLLAYASRIDRNWYLSVALVAMVCLQCLLAFIVDIKGLAMLGWVLVIMTCVLVDGRVAKSWVVAAAVFVFVAFPVFQAYRTVTEGGRLIKREAAVEHLLAVLQKSLDARDRVNTGNDRAQTFFERLSMKESVRMIVAKTGREVEFQRGYTLLPIAEAFIPRFLWTEKPDIPTGQIVNKVFHVSDQEETYISPSHLGELYWNFGWPGVIAGMTAIGVLCGVVGRFNLREGRTITRLLVTVLTIRFVIAGFESSIAAPYVTWLRSLAAIGLLHLIFARLVVQPRLAVPASEPSHRLLEGATPKIRAFPNLLT